MRRVVFRSLGLALLLTVSGIASACDREGPAERAGEAVDDAADDAEDAVEDAVE
jgi:hypothetical protein